MLNFKPSQEVAIIPNIKSDIMGEKLKVLDYNSTYQFYVVLVLTGPHKGQEREIIEGYLIPYESLALLKTVNQSVFNNYVVTDKKIKIRRDHLLGVTLGKTRDLLTINDFNLFSRVRILPNANILTPWSRWPGLTALDAGEQIGEVYGFCQLTDYDTYEMKDAVKVTWGSFYGTFLPQHLELA